MYLSTLALSISKATKRFPRLHNLARLAYCLFRPGIRFQIERAFIHQNEIVVLKIGANDGVENDPIADLLLDDSRYRGVLVEPVPYYAKLLADNYRNTGRFRIEQVAIAAASGTATMYYVTENSLEILGSPLPHWLRGVTSLDRSHVLKHLAPDVHSIVEETVVECLNVKGLLERNHVEKIGLLQIDAEGFDWVVLEQFDFGVFRPKVVLFERRHLNTRDQESAQSKMEQAGYQVSPMETDFFCLLK